MTSTTNKKANSIVVELEQAFQKELLKIQDIMTKLYLDGKLKPSDLIIKEPIIRKEATMRIRLDFETNDSGVEMLIINGVSAIKTFHCNGYEITFNDGDKVIYDNVAKITIL